MIKPWVRWLSILKRGDEWMVHITNASICTYSIYPIVLLVNIQKQESHEEPKSLESGETFVILTTM
jgi:hypothetical protein